MVLLFCFSFSNKIFMFPVLMSRIKLRVVFFYWHSCSILKEIFILNFNVSILTGGQSNFA